MIHNTIQNVIELLIACIALMCAVFAVLKGIEDGTVHVDRVSKSEEVTFDIVDAHFYTSNKTCLILKYDSNTFSVIVDKPLEDAVTCIGTSIEGTIYYQKTSNEDNKYIGFEADIN